MPYKHLIFDLDHTLWDHHTNSRIALAEVYEIYHLQEIGIPSALEFGLKFNQINSKLWLAYELGQISQVELRTARFRQIFSELGVSDHSLCDEISDTYLDISPRKSTLLPNTIEVLEYLFPKYPMYILTNGFNDIQDIKMEASGLKSYFKKMITSQIAGCKKPEPKMFHFTLNMIDAQASDCLMIGDTFHTDILGAMNVGMDAVFFNPENQIHDKKPTFEIKDLKELMEIL
jgi:YjjG family noncanonical pyrimidine nucleotidase